jgi:glycosyltransferase involved in cell wall biosynthesis
MEFMSESPVTTGSNPADRQAGRNNPLTRSLSVAIPAFNEERNIEGTVAVLIASAAKVPDLRIEILVVDDGSTDRTAEIVRNLSQQGNSIRLIQNTINMGLGASIRRAIDSAQGDKFLIIPADNDIPANTLELLLKNAYAADVVMCYFHNNESRGGFVFLYPNSFC